MKNCAKYYLIVALTLTLASAKLFGQLPSVVFDNQHDYSYMWWLNTTKNSNSKTFAVKTSNYALSFDYSLLSIKNFIINSQNKDEDVVLREKNSQSFPTSNTFVFRFGMDNNGVRKWCTNTSGVLDDCQLVETGKYFHRRFINKLTDLTNCDIYNSGLEISAWADRLNIMLRAIPTAELQNAGLIMSLTFPTAYNTVLTKGDIKAFKNPLDGSGFILLKSSSSSNLIVAGSTVTVKLANAAIVPIGVEMVTGLIIYPVKSDIDTKLNELYEQETVPLTITAVQQKPTKIALNVQYDIDMGWHQVLLRNDGNSSDPDIRNNRIEDVDFSITNSSGIDKTVRLNFSKERQNSGLSVFSITGISAVLRDTKGNPIGIPIQLSKNWHTSTDVNSATQRFRGSWYRGLCVLTVPAKSTISLEYTSVNALWGGVPAASHAQLCLVGWGTNQQWDESAIGSWGESITYEPELNQAGAPVLDFRPLMIKAVDGSQWGWTGNMGGAGFFNYTKTDGTRAWHSRMRTQYKMYSPNLTEVTYAGTTDDDVIDMEYTASIARSEDIVRGIYRIKMKVLTDFSFNDFVFFQTAAATYHYTKSNTLAWGNETGLIKQWPATIGTASKYVAAKEVVTGNLPWFSFTNSILFSDTQKFLPANRGFVIRKWNARINGQDSVPPYFAEYCAVGGNGNPSGLINITVPLGCKAFQKGDYVDAEIVLFQIPKVSTDYYGSNQNLIRALATKANTWQMVYREAIGNNLEVEVLSGSLIRNYPLKIDAVKDYAHFTVQGGRDYVPVTISNVNSYLNPELYQKVNGIWTKINQEKYGNDFWQSDYNSTTNKWDITYNINLDSENDAVQKTEFKFQLKPDSTTNTAELRFNSHIAVFPNPLMQGVVSINLTNLKKYDNTEIKIFDMHSKLLVEKKSTNVSNLTIQTYLVKGIYLIVVKNANENLVKKIIVS